MVRFRSGPVCAACPCGPVFWVDLLVRVARLVLLLCFCESSKFGESSRSGRSCKSSRLGMVWVALVPVLVICGPCGAGGSPGLVLAVRGSAEWIAHNTNVVSRTRLHKYIFRWIVAVLSWEQCPCTLTNLRPESVSLPANSAMHKHCVYRNNIFFGRQTLRCRKEIMRSMTLFVFVFGISFRKKSIDGGAHCPQRRAPARVATVWLRADTTSM